MYLLKRIDQGGGYVSRPGYAKSYVYNIINACVFQSKEDAERSACGNEIPIRLDSLIYIKE